ncbi:TPA: hypothetical protein NIE69_002122 [Pseudomonas aeruginosa]|nr:hypothetical protein [Pseudomonas aeruginosa]
MNEVTEMLNKEKFEKLQNKVFSLNSKIDYFDRYISKTELRIKNLDTDHSVITNVEIKEVKEQGFKDKIFIIAILTIMTFMLSKIENGSILACGLAVCIIFLIAASAKAITKRVYILKLKRLDIEDRKLFLTNIFNLRIKKCRRGIEICQREIGEIKIQIDELKKEKQYSI